MSQPRVAGSASTDFGRTPARSGRELFAEASREALADAGIPPTDVDGRYYGNFMGSIAEQHGHQAPLMAARRDSTPL